jgi:cobalamin biosynthesis protein CobD/CbiB
METFALGGLIGGALYKVVDTADSMIGHKDERYKAFGWAAARLDDVANLPPSRLAALWLIVAAALTAECSTSLPVPLWSFRRAFANGWRLIPRGRWRARR